MQLPTNKAPLSLFLIMLIAQTAFSVSTLEEREIWKLWQLHVNPTNSHAKVYQACRQFQKALPTSSLRPFCLGLAGWHLLKMKTTNAASTMLSAMISDSSSPLAAAGTEMARRWLTRMDREKVRRALTGYYADKIKFPPKLSDLKSISPELIFPSTDRWGKPWQYKLTRFKHILKGLNHQRYALQSSKLPGTSDLATALARRYARNPAWLKPVSIVATSVGKPNVIFTTFGARPKKAMLSEGSTLNGISVAYIGTGIIILSDGDYWMLVLKPK